MSCFAEARDEMVFFCVADKLAGYNTLSKDDQVRGDDRLEIIILIFLQPQDMLLEKLPKVKRKIEANGGDEPDSKKMKKEDPEEAAEKEKMKKQNKQMFYYRDLLSKHLKKQDLYNLLEHNKQEIPTGEVSTWQAESCQPSPLYLCPRTELWTG